MIRTLFITLCIALQPALLYTHYRAATIKEINQRLINARLAYRRAMLSQQQVFTCKAFLSFWSSMGTYGITDKNSTYFKQVLHLSKSPEGQAHFNDCLENAEQMIDYLETNLNGPDATDAPKYALAREMMQKTLLAIKAGDQNVLYQE